MIDLSRYKKQIESTAEYSSCKKYRFQLTRIWDDKAPHVCFIALNPSTATEFEDDPTVRRMIGFAKQWKHGGVYVVNLFSIRSPSPSDIVPELEPTADNDAWIKKSVLGCETTIACWGAEPAGIMRAKKVMTMLAKEGVGEIMCLRTTKGGHPYHPLYLPSKIKLGPYLEYELIKRVYKTKDQVS